MMRSVLFRGKRVDNGEWVYGSLIVSGAPYLDNACTIVSFSGGVPQFYAVQDCTVGQYTCISDCCGNRIFEGDILRQVVENDPSEYNPCGTVGDVRVVGYDQKRCGWVPFACGDGCGCCETDVYRSRYMEVIGNVYDNPELLEES